MTWFYKNYIVLNVDKCHFVTVGFNESFPDFSFNDTTILGIVLDNKLSFKSHS